MSGDYAGLPEDRSIILRDSGCYVKNIHPASSQPIDSRSAPAVRFYRTVIYLPHGAKYNPEQGLESSVSGCSYASNHCPNRRFCAQEFP